MVNIECSCPAVTGRATTSVRWNLSPTAPTAQREEDRKHVDGETNYQPNGNILAMNPVRISTTKQLVSAHGPDVQAQETDEAAD